MKTKYSFANFILNMVLLNCVLWIPFALLLLCDQKELIDTLYFNGSTLYVILYFNVIILLINLGSSTYKLNESLENEITLTNELETFKTERGAGCYEFLNKKIEIFKDSNMTLIKNNDTLRAECLRKTDIIDTYRRREKILTEFKDNLMNFVNNDGTPKINISLEIEIAEGKLTQNKF